MQKIKKTAVLLLLFGVFFSSCEKQHGQDPKQCMNEAELLSQLRAYNDSLMRQEKTITKSPNWRNVAQVAIADITGAKEGAKYGGRLGARIGTLLGSPIYGAATGALVGGVAGAVAGPGASVVKPVGDIFLNLIFVLVVPLVFFSIAQSMYSLRKGRLVAVYGRYNSAIGEIN